MGHDDVSGDGRHARSAARCRCSATRPSEAVTEELRSAGVQLKTGAVARRDGSGLMLEPGGERLGPSASTPSRGCVGPALDGLPHDEEGFIVAGDDGARRGLRAHLGGRRRRRLARSSSAASPPIRRAARRPRSRALAGVERRPRSRRARHPGRLLTGRAHAPPERPRRRRGRAAVVAAGQDRGRVPAALADRARRRAARRRGAGDEGITVHRPISELRGARARVPARPRARVPQRRPGDRLARPAHARGARALSAGSAGRDDPQHVERRDDAAGRPPRSDDDDVRGLVVGHQRGRAVELGVRGHRERRRRRRSPRPSPARRGTRRGARPCR